MKLKTKLKGAVVLASLLPALLMGDNYSDSQASDPQPAQEDEGEIARGGERGRGGGDRSRRGFEGRQGGRGYDGRGADGRGAAFRRGEDAGLVNGAAAGAGAAGAVDGGNYVPYDNTPNQAYPAYSQQPIIINNSPP